MIECRPKSAPVLNTIPISTLHDGQDAGMKGKTPQGLKDAEIASSRSFVLVRHSRQDDKEVQIVEWQVVIALQ